MLAAIAEFEWELINERTGDDRKRAQAKGVKFGRKPKLMLHQRDEAIHRRAARPAMDRSQTRSEAKNSIMESSAR